MLLLQFRISLTLCSSAVEANTQSEWIPECKACRAVHGVGSSLLSLIIPLTANPAARPMLSKRTPTFQWRLNGGQITNLWAVRTAL